MDRPDVSVRRRNRSLYVLLAVVLAGILIRLAYVDQPLRYDEAISYVYYGSQPLDVSLTTYDNPNNHLLNTLLVHLCVRLFGSSDEWVLRFPVFVAGVLLIPASYATARKFYDERVALLTGALVAAYPQIIFYATNSRGYSFLALSFVILLGLAHDLRRRSRWRLWAGFVVVSVLGFYAVLSMLYPFGIVCAWLSLSILLEDTGRERWRKLRDLAIAIAATGGLTLLLYAPATDSRMFRALSRSLPLDQFREVLLPLFRGTLTLWSNGIPAGVVVLLVVCFMVGLIVEQRSGRYRVPLWGTVVVSMAAIWLVQRPSTLGYHYYRLLFFLLPLCLMVCASGMVTLLGWVTPRRAPVTAALALVIAVGGSGYVLHSQSVYDWKETGPFQDAEDVVRLLRDQLHAGDAVMCYGSCREILYYYFDQYGLDRDYLNTDVDQAGRIIVVMNYYEFMGVLVDKPVTRYLLHNLTPETRLQFGNVALMQAFQSAFVYAVRREAPADD